MINTAETTRYSNAQGATAMPPAGNVAVTAPPIQPLPMPGNPPLIPPEMPVPNEPLGAPAPTENPIPVREPPVTTPPQS